MIESVYYCPKCQYMTIEKEQPNHEHTLEEAGYIEIKELEEWQRLK